MITLKPEEFTHIVAEICRRDTSADPNGWSPENPTWGHCAVVSLLAQDEFSGVLIRHSLEGIPELAHIRSHYTNQLPDGSRIDFTSAQFEKILPEGLPGNLSRETKARDYLLSHPDTRTRYELLKTRFESQLALP